MRRYFLCAALALLASSLSARAQEDELPEWLREQWAGAVPKSLLVSESGTLRWTGILADRRLRHADPVRAVAVDPDGEWIVSAGDGKAIKFWDADSGRELRSIESSGHRVYSLAVSPDGSWIASGDGERRVRIWDVEKGKLLRIQSGHTDDVRAVAVSPDGRWTVSGGDDRSVHVYTAEKRRQILRLGFHDGWVYSVAVSPDGSRIASGDDKGKIKVWNAATGDQVRALDAHRSDVKVLMFLPDGSRLLSGSQDSTLKLWEVKSGKLLRTLAGHETWVTAAAVSPDGRRIVSGDHLGKVRIWETETGRTLQTIDAHEAEVGSLAFLPDGDRFVSGGHDGMVRMWDAATGKLSLGPAGRLYEAAVSADGSRIATPGSDRVLRIWNSASGKEIRAIPGRESPCGEVALDPLGQWIAWENGAGTIRFLDAKTGAEFLTRTHENFGPITELVSGPDGSWLLCASRPSYMHLTLSHWDAGTGRELRWIHAPVLAMAAAATPEGTAIVTRGRDKSIAVWDPTSGRVLHRLPPSGSRWSPVFVSAEGRWILSRAEKEEEGALRVWELATGREVALLRGAEGRMNGMAGSAAEGWVALAEETGTIRLWTAATGWAARTLPGHEGGADDLAASPDGKLLVSSGADKVVRVWDPKTGAERYALEGHELPVSAITVGPGGRRIVSGDSEGMVKVWDARTGSPLGSVDLCAPDPDLDGDAPFDGPFTSAPIGASVTSMLAISPDGRRIVTAGAATVPSVWDVETGRRLFRLHVPTGPSGYVAFSPDGGEIHSVWSGGKGYRAAHVLDSKTGNAVGRLGGRGRARTPLAVSPDGTWVLANTGVYDVKTGRKLRSIQGHRRGAESAVVSRDGRWIVTGDMDERVHVCDAGTGEELLRFEGHDGDVIGVAVSDDRRWVYSASGDGTLVVWDTRNEEDPLADRILVDGIPVALVRHGPRLWVTCKNGTVCRYEHSPPEKGR